MKLEHFNPYTLVRNLYPAMASSLVQRVLDSPQDDQGNGTMHMIMTGQVAQSQGSYLEPVEFSEKIFGLAA